VGVQGDEPLLEPEIIDAVVEALQDTPDAVYSTPCTLLKTDEVSMLGRVKCVTDQVPSLLRVAPRSPMLQPGSCRRAVPLKH
jgi:CMP-2-keto-3-deoxyoctulosonic acid synthetase